MQEIWYENREYGIKMVNMLYGWQCDDKKEGAKSKTIY